MIKDRDRIVTRFHLFCARLTLPAFVGLFACVGVHAWAASSENKSVPPVSQPASPTNIVTQAAVQQGALACAGRINQVTNFLGYTSKAGAMLMAPPGQQDQRLLPVILAIPMATRDAYVSVTFAPNQANGCGATYDAVVYWDDKCSAVAAKQFATLKNAGLLGKDITVLDGGLSTKVFLVSAGKGCVSIKKEVVL